MNMNPKKQQNVFNTSSITKTDLRCQKSILGIGNVKPVKILKHNCSCKIPLINMFKITQPPIRLNSIGIIK